MLLLFTPFGVFGQDTVIDVMRDELGRQFAELGRQSAKPYYMNFRIDDIAVYSVSANFGALVASDYNRNSYFMSQIRLGDMDFDNYLGDNAYKMSIKVHPQQVSIGGDSEASLRQSIWRDVNARYKLAVQYFEYVKAQRGVSQQGQDKAPDWTPATPNKHYEPELGADRRRFDKEYWEARMREYSSIPMADHNVMQSTASIAFVVNRKYFVDSDGSDIAQNLTYCTMFVQAAVRADDGMELPLYKMYFAFTPEGLPTPEQVRRDVRDMAVRLSELRTAPLIQAYTGPALLSGDAAGVFFHEIFGHRIEGQPMKSNTDGQTFKKLVGQNVLPSTISVYDDPTVRRYNGEELNGYYLFDEQGMKGERVEVVKNGVMNDFLMTRTAIEGFDRTNGHARAQIGYDPTSRQSNLIVECSDPKSEDELRALLITEIKAQGKEYGFYFRQVTGGFTMTSATSTNSFQVNPLEVYKVYADQRPDELVRGVDMIGTPLSMFSNISHAGAESRIFTGTCVATSGNTPVTAIAPTILVSKIEVQRRADSKNIPYILSRP